MHVPAPTVCLLLQMASADMEKQVRQKLGIPLGKEVEWQWFMSAFSPRVRMLVWQGDTGIGLLGQGSTARVL